MDIRAAFDEMVAELDWMDIGTRARAHQKLHAMRPFVGFPNWITNQKELNKFYDGVNMSSLTERKKSKNYVKIIFCCIKVICTDV